MLKPVLFTTTIPGLFQALDFNRTSSFHHILKRGSCGGVRAMVSHRTKPKKKQGQKSEKSDPPIGVQNHGGGKVCHCSNMMI